MDTFAYCARSFSRFVRWAAGITPTTCPPIWMDTFDPSWLEGRDFIYFKLHGREGERFWYGDHWTTALSAEQLAQANLSGAVVFVANCWLVDNEGAYSPMMKALMRARPWAVVGGSGENYALTNRLGGTDLLGLYLRVFLQFFPVHLAFKLAKSRLHLKRPDRTTKDTLAFQVWYRS